MSEQLFRATLRSQERLFEKISFNTYKLLGVGMGEAAYFGSDSLTDLRPVRIVEDGQVVLDISGKEFIRIMDNLMFCATNKDAQLLYGAYATIKGLRNQIDAQTKPPRMEEPQGFRTIVEARSASSDDAETWQPVLWGGDKKWMTLRGHALLLADWSDLIDPQPVRDGV